MDQIPLLLTWFNFDASIDKESHASIVCGDGSNFISQFIIGVISNPCWDALWRDHYTDIIMSAMASQITSLTIVYLTVYSDADQRKHQSSASLAFVWEIHRWPVSSPHKWPVTRKMLPFDDVIMISYTATSNKFPYRRRDHAQSNCKGIILCKSMALHRHIGVETKWSFCRRHFQKHFVQWTCVNFDNFTKF